MCSEIIVRTTSAVDLHSRTGDQIEVCWNLDVESDRSWW